MFGRESIRHAVWRDEQQGNVRIQRMSNISRDRNFPHHPVYVCDRNGRIYTVWIIIGNGKCGEVIEPHGRAIGAACQTERIGPRFLVRFENERKVDRSAADKSWGSADFESGGV